MKFSKKIIFCTLFLLGIVLTNNIFIQHCKAVSIVELVSKKNSPSITSFYDSEIHQDEQYCNTPMFLSIIAFDSQYKHYNEPSKLTLPYNTIWQPPQL